MSTTTKRLFHLVEQAIRILELLLSFLLIIGVVVEGVFMILRLHTILWTGQGGEFQTFLDSALLYIIGLEVALMLIKRDPNLVIDILIFAIARKMIMTMETGMDFLLGALAIFLLYMVKCYGISCIWPGATWFRGKVGKTSDETTPENKM